MLVGLFVGGVNRQDLLCHRNCGPIVAACTQRLGHLQKELEQARPVIFTFAREPLIIETGGQLALPKRQLTLEQSTVRAF